MNVREAPEPQLLPARMLNEYVYCPRLFYLEWVQGEWEDSADTVDGRARHSRVDVERGDLTATASDAGEPAPARSLWLSSEALAFTARIDLVEAEGATVTPVEYKRGKPPAGPEQVWEADAVQLGVQGLLLREAGYRCDGGVIYYSSTKERIPVPLSAELIEKTLAVAEVARGVAASGRAPAPLVDSPKCVRCSLAGICLPDEVNALNGRLASEGDAVRPLLAARDDAQPLYVQEQGAVVGKSGDLLQVRQRGELLQEARLGDCSQVSVFGSVQVTTQALSTLLTRGIPLCFFSTGGWYMGMAAGLPGKNVDLRRQQHVVGADPERSLALARAIVSGKVSNSRVFLRRNHPQLPPAVREELRRLGRAAAGAASFDTLLGLEGAAGRLYFHRFGELFSGGEFSGFFDFTGRNRRPPADPVNALLSYVYALLVKDLTVTAWAVGLDPYSGFYHQPHYGRPALALDLAEEFRTVIGDSVVVTLVNTGEIRPRHFVSRSKAWSLTTEGRKKVLAAYERRMSGEIRHPVFGYSVSYRRCLELQTRLLARALTGEIPAYLPLRVR